MSLLTLALLGCIVRGDGVLHFDSKEWRSATPDQRFEVLWRARGSPEVTATELNRVLHDYLNVAPDDATRLAMVAGYRWWLGETEPDRAERSAVMNQVLELTERALRNDGRSVAAHYFAAQALFIRSTDQGWAADTRARFFEHVEAVLSQAKYFEQAGIFELLGRYWLSEDEPERAVAWAEAAYGRDNTDGISERLLVVELIGRHRSRPRRDDLQALLLSKLVSRCGEPPEYLRALALLKPHWHSLTGTEWQNSSIFSP